MSPILIAVAVVLAVGIWGYIQKGDPMYAVNRLSAAQIAQLATNAGFTGDDIVTATAIAMGESGGDPQALGDTNITPGGSLGLWQINLRWHPEYANNPNALYDPQTNANAAYQVYRTQGWTAWGAYNNGHYQAFLPDAQAAVQA